MCIRHINIIQMKVAEVTPPPLCSFCPFQCWHSSRSCISIGICDALVFESVFYAAVQYLFVCVQPEHFVDRAGQRPRVMVAVIHAQCALELAENSALSND